MNLVLLFESDLVDADRVVLTGRRRDHIAGVHKVAAGDTLAVGLEGGRIGSGTVTRIDDSAVELRVRFDHDPPAPLGVILVLAVPRPKVLNRVIAAATSLGIKRIALVNAWRVEKSYWKSPRLADANLHAQCVAGLEQAKDTALPRITLHRFFRRFVEEELDDIAAGSVRLVAHPYASDPCPRTIDGPVTLAIGPEGGFVTEELTSLERAGFQAVTIGPRVLRVETAVVALVARICG